MSAGGADRAELILSEVIFTVLLEGGLVVTDGTLPGAMDVEEKEVGGLDHDV